MTEENGSHSRRSLDGFKGYVVKSFLALAAVLAGYWFNEVNSSMDRMQEITTDVALVKHIQAAQVETQREVVAELKALNVKLETYIREERTRRGRRTDDPD